MTSNWASEYQIVTLSLCKDFSFSIFLFSITIDLSKIFWRSITADLFTYSSTKMKMDFIAHYHSRILVILETKPHPNCAIFPLGVVVAFNSRVINITLNLNTTVSSLKFNSHHALELTVWDSAFLPVSLVPHFVDSGSFCKLWHWLLFQSS